MNESTSALRVDELIGVEEVEREERARLSVDEAALIDRCLAGDETAFDQLVAQYQDMVFNLALRLFGKREEALDLSQEVFLQVYRKLGSFRRDSSLRTWIYRIVINRGKNRQRWWRRREGEMTAVRVDELERGAAGNGNGGVPSVSEAPDEALHRREIGELVHGAIGALPYDQRSVVLLREVEGLSYEEIARTLGLAIGTVKSRLARARRALRERLGPELDGR